MLEKKPNKNAVYKGKVLETLLSDLSKIFDCICRDLLIAELNVYDLSLLALNKILHLIAALVELQR